MVEKRVVLSALLQRVRAAAIQVAVEIEAAVRAATRPAAMVVGLLFDATRSREELVAENALLRQQLIVAARAAERPKFAAYERGILVLLARLVPRWRDAVRLVKPETILRVRGHLKLTLCGHQELTHPEEGAAFVATGN